MILLGVVSLLYACAKSPAYLHSTEERVICHKKYRSGAWYPVELQIPLWLVYRDHIGMHPNDYWGYCEEEIIPIPDIDGKKDWEKEGYFGERLRPRR